MSRFNKCLYEAHTPPSSIAPGAYHWECIILILAGIVWEGGDRKHKMTTRLARVLYDTVIETVEHRMRQDGWIQEDHIQQKEGEHAQADSSGDDDTMTHAMVERGNKRCRKTASTADDSRAANGSTSGGLNGSPAKQSSSHKDKPPASKISEDVLQKIISVSSRRTVVLEEKDGALFSPHSR